MSLLVENKLTAYILFLNPFELSPKEVQEAVPQMYNPKRNFVNIPIEVLSFKNRSLLPYQKLYSFKK